MPNVISLKFDNLEVLESFHTAVGFQWPLMQACLPAARLVCSVTRLIDFGWRIIFMLLQLCIQGFVRSHVVLRTSCCSDGGAGEGAALGAFIFKSMAVQQMACGSLLGRCYGQISVLRAPVVTPRPGVKSSGICQLARLLCWPDSLSWQVQSVPLVVANHISFGQQLHLHRAFALMWGMRLESNFPKCADLVPQRSLVFPASS